MAISRRSGRSGRSRLTLVLLLLTSVTVLTLDYRGSNVLEPARDAVSGVFGKLRSGTDVVTSPIADAWNGAWHYDDVRKENQQLRTTIDDLKGQAAQNADAATQLEQLAALEKLTVVSKIPKVTARVVSGPVSNFEHTIELDKGSDDGLKVGMPVVTGAGLVGRLIQVTSSHSTVRLLTDPDFLVGVRMHTSQEIGILHGTGDGSPLRIDSGLDPKAKVLQGDLVTTSGIDRSIFPAGIPVGRATSANLSPDQLTQVVTVVSLADLGRLFYVHVLLWNPAQ